MQDYDELKIILSKRDKEIQQLVKHLGEQDSLVSQYHITRRSDHLKSKVSNNCVGVRSELEPESCEVLTHKIELMEDIVGLYKKDSDEVKAKLNIVDEESKNQKNGHEIQKEKILAEDLRKKEIHETRILQLRNEFEEYKKSVEQEIELRQVIESRQLNMIDTLKQELKSAKSVIQNPRLRSKVQTKLKVRSPIKEAKNSTPPPSTPPYYRKVSSKCDTTRRVSTTYRENILMSVGDDRDNSKLRDSSNSNADSSSFCTSVLGLPTGWKVKETSSGRFRSTPNNML